MPRPNDSHRSLLPLEQERTLIAVVELSRSSWLVDFANRSAARGRAPSSGESSGRSSGPHFRSCIRSF